MYNEWVRDQELYALHIIVMEACSMLFPVILNKATTMYNDESNEYIWLFVLCLSVGSFRGVGNFGNEKVER